MDDKRATVTCANDEASEAQQSLKEGAIHVSSVALSGRFHWPGHQDDMDTLIEFVNKNPALQLIDASSTILPTRANTGGQYLQ